MPTGDPFCGLQPLRCRVEFKRSCRRGPTVFLSFPYKVLPDRILLDIPYVNVVISSIANSMVGKTALPDRESQMQFFPEGVR